MDEPGNGSSFRDAAERLVLAARDAIEELGGRWRGEARLLGERSGASLESTFRELGLVTRREFEELELRVAQLEHRLRLVEGPRAVPDPPREA